MKVVCAICNLELDTDFHATVVKVLAWAEYKNNRASGQIRDASAPLDFAHKICQEVGTNPANIQTLF